MERELVRYLTKDGDMLDAICYAYYGQSSRYVESVLAHNPDLVELGPVLPAGIHIVLPVLPELTTVRHALRLWE